MGGARSEAEVSDRLLAMGGVKPAGDDDGALADEKEQEAMERLIGQMAFLRERGETLSPEARRERAAAAATEMARLFGDQEGDSNGGDSDEDPEAGQTV